MMSAGAGEISLPFGMAWQTDKDKNSWMETQRIYLIGAGIIAHQHAATLRRLPRSVEIVLSVADPNKQALAAFAEQYPHARSFEDAQTMLAEPALENDIVIVATPPVTHYELACAALATGRHVLCEKPLALDRAQARQMLAVARTHGRVLGCCSVRFLHWPPAEAARRLLQEDVLGQLYHVRFLCVEQRNRPGIEYQPGTPWFLDRTKSGGGTLMDRAPYEFGVLNDLLRPTRVEVLSAWLANPITTGMPPASERDVEQHAGASLRYHLANGTTCMLTYERASGTHSEAQSCVEITGLKGSLRWVWPHGFISNTLTHTYDNDGRVESKTISFPRPDPDDLRFGEKPLYYFYQYLQHQPSSAIVNEQALFNFSCIRAIYDCASSGEPQTIVLGE
jgi:predicted dehydrogenase